MRPSTRTDGDRPPRGRRLPILAAAAVALAVPATSNADYYNPTTGVELPWSAVIPSPTPTFDPPPVYYTPLNLLPTTPGTGSTKPTKPTKPAVKIDPITGFRRSPVVFKQANRQMAKLFTARLGKAKFKSARFIKEADKGTFRKAYLQLVKPIGWSDNDYSHALASYTVASWLIANNQGDLTTKQRIGARDIQKRIRATIAKNPKMKKSRPASRQLATDRLNILTTILIVQWANATPDQRVQLAESVRKAGLKTFKGDLTLVDIGYDGFERRADT